jgi:hypothetical protein
MTSIPRGRAGAGGEFARAAAVSRCRKASVSWARQGVHSSPGESRFGGTSREAQVARASPSGGSVADRVPLLAARPYLDLGRKRWPVWRYDAASPERNSYRHCLHLGSWQQQGRRQRPRQWQICIDNGSTMLLVRLASNGNLEFGMSSWAFRGRYFGVTGLAQPDLVVWRFRRI